MENFKKNIVSVFQTKNQSLNDAQYRVFNSISNAIDYAWNNWDEKILATYYKGEKPESANQEFIENWIDNEDFEADGFNEVELRELFS